MEKMRSAVALLMLAAIIALSRIPAPSAAQWEEAPLITPTPTSTVLIAPDANVTPSPEVDHADP